MIEVSLELAVPPNCPLQVAERNIADVRVLGLRRSRGSVEHLLEITADTKDQSDLMRELRKYAMNGELDVAPVANGKLIAMMACKPCPLYEAVSRFEGFLTSESVALGSMQVRALFRKDESLKDALEFLDDEKIPTKVLRVATIGRKVALTARQHELLKTAFEKGYMDCPRRIGIKVLSDTLKVSKSAVSETLRRAERKIIEHYLKNGI